jgi:DNA-binding LytR/AlgR family response regulator
MAHPFLQNSGRASLYILVLTLLAFAVGGALSPLSGGSFGQDLCTGLLLAASLGVIMLPLWNAIRYGSPGHHIHTGVLHKMLIHAALLLIFITLWLGIGALCIVFLWSARRLANLLPALPFLALTGVLLYTIATLIYSQLLADIEEDKETQEQPDITVQEEQETEEKPLENIAVKNGRSINVVPVSEIRYLKSEGDYVMIHTISGRFLKEQTMKYFEKNLPAAQFVRVHRSYIVNMLAITRIERYGKGEQSIVLQGGAVIRISDSGYRALKTRLKL